MPQAALAQNWFAAIALLVWPLVALFLYSTRPVRRRRFGPFWEAIYYCLRRLCKIGGRVPQLDKTSIPALAAYQGRRWLREGKSPSDEASVFQSF